MNTLGKEIYVRIRRHHQRPYSPLCIGVYRGSLQFFCGPRTPSLYFQGIVREEEAPAEATLQINVRDKAAKESLLETVALMTSEMHGVSRSEAMARFEQFVKENEDTLAHRVVFPKRILGAYSLHDLEKELNVENPASVVDGHTSWRMKPALLSSAFVPSLHAELGIAGQAASDVCCFHIDFSAVGLTNAAGLSSQIDAFFKGLPALVSRFFPDEGGARGAVGFRRGGDEFEIYFRRDGRGDADLTAFGRQFFEEVKAYRDGCFKTSPENTAKLDMASQIASQSAEMTKLMHAMATEGADATLPAAVRFLTEQLSARLGEEHSLEDIKGTGPEVRELVSEFEATAETSRERSVPEFYEWLGDKCALPSLYHEGVDIMVGLFSALSTVGFPDNTRGSDIAMTPNMVVVDLAEARSVEEFARARAAAEDVIAYHKASREPLTFGVLKFENVSDVFPKLSAIAEKEIARVQGDIRAHALAKEAIDSHVEGKSSFVERRLNQLEALDHLYKDSSGALRFGPLRNVRRGEYPGIKGRNGAYYTVFDFPGFKALNHEFGEGRADELIHESLSKVLKKLPSYARVYRVGGGMLVVETAARLSRVNELVAALALPPTTALWETEGVGALIYFAAKQAEKCLQAHEAPGENEEGEFTPIGQKMLVVGDVRAYHSVKVTSNSIDPNGKILGKVLSAHGL